MVTVTPVVNECSGANCHRFFTERDHSPVDGMPACGARVGKGWRGASLHLPGLQAAGASSSNVADLPA